MKKLFDEEAKRNEVYPLLPGTEPLPTPQQGGKTTFTYREEWSDCATRLHLCCWAKHSRSRQMSKFLAPTAQKA